MEKGKVSILIPVYNRKNIIDITLESALRQTYKNHEIIIVDNCSTDGTYEYLCEKYGNKDKVYIYRNSENVGPVKNWIKCFEKSTGEYIKFLWSDDWIADDFLEKTVKCLEKDKTLGMAMTNICWFTYGKTKESVGIKLVIKRFTNKLLGKWIHSHTGYYLGRTGIYSHESYIEPFLAGIKSCVSASCALFRRECVSLEDKIENPFGVDFNRTGAGSDLLQFLNAFKIKDKFYYIDEKLASLGVSTNSITVENKDLAINYLIAAKYWLDSGMLDSCQSNYYHRQLIWNILERWGEEALDIIHKLYGDDYENMPTNFEMRKWRNQAKIENISCKLAYWLKLKEEPEML